MLPLHDTIPRRHPPLVIWLLIALNTLIFIFETRLPLHEAEALLFTFGMVPANITLSDNGLTLASLVPFVSYMFLHGSWLHLAGNMWILFLFGDNVEDRMGHVRFLVFYLLCGILAGGIQFATRSGTSLPTVGASGAIAGIMGSYFVLFPASRILTLIPVFFFPLILELPATFFLMLWFLSQVLAGLIPMGGGASGIAWWAHAGGFLAGAGMYRIFLRRDTA